MWESPFFYLRPAWTEGDFQVTFQDRYFFLFYTVIVFRQKAQKLSQYEEVFFLKSSRWDGWKGILSRRSTKQQWQVHPGDTFQPQVLTPAPLTRRTSSISLPGALRFSLVLFSTQSVQSKSGESGAASKWFWFVHLSHVNMQSFWFYFCTWFLPCIVHPDVRSILDK